MSILQRHPTRKERTSAQGIEAEIATMVESLTSKAGIRLR